MQNAQVTDKLINHFNERWPVFYEELKKWVRIPSVSFPGFPKENVQKSAQAVAESFRKFGFQNVEIITLSEDVHPYVYADFIQDPKLPTVLLYAHHDVQPTGDEELWNTKPFEPTEKQGPGGLRMYARGAADDKAGALIHLAAVATYLETKTLLPVNVKVIIEGEEEIGSSNLFQFLEKYNQKVQADVMVLTDTLNFQSGIPSLTVALRGMVGVDIEIKGLKASVHSGMWGGPVPDPAMALNKILAKMIDDNGQIAVPGVLEQVPELAPHERSQLNDLPFDEKTFRDQSGMLASVHFLNPSVNPWEQLWRLPSLTVNAQQASSRKQAGNVIVDSAWARVTLRVAPGMDPEKTQKCLIDFIKANVPWGLECHIREDVCAPAWKTDTTNPAFRAAEKALEKGYGHPVNYIGCGGSIPFVKPFSDSLGGAPALLVGVEDPYTGAHGPNESVLLSDLQKACKSEVHLFAELAQTTIK